MKPARVLITLALSLAAAACGRQRPAPVPREHAYPRIELYPAEYRNVAVDPPLDSLAINAAARLTAVGSQQGWFDISYPAYGITVNCTLTPTDGADDTEARIANRLERMARNVDGQTAEAVETGRATIIIAHRALRTPVQFLATDSTGGWILSGVAVGDFQPSTDPDSVAPIVDAVADDMIYMLRQL